MVSRCRLLCFWGFAQLVLASGSLGLPSHTHAQLGIGGDALPRLVSVPSAAPSPLVAGALAVGYGYTGEVLGLDDSHQRIVYEGAVSAAPLPELILAGRLAGRIDAHDGEGHEGADGFATYGNLGARGRFEAREHLHLGLEVVAHLPPSKDRKRSLKAVTPELNGMATYQTPRFTLSGALGARINRGDQAFPSSSPLNAYEVLALGLSDDAQLLAGIGAAVAAGPLWCLVDVQLEPYVGAGAPAFKYAPTRLGVGLRGSVRRWLQLGLHVQVSPSPYPPASQVADIPVVPRVAALGYVTMQWDGREPAPQPEPPTPAPEPVASQPSRSPLAGQVTGLHGHAIDDSEVELLLTSGDQSHSLTLPAGTTHFRFDDLEPGTWQLRVRAEGYEPASRSLQVPAAEPPEIHLDRALPPGHIEVRVQDFRGRQVDARVVVLPDRTPFQPTSETGLYNLDLAPGEYEIEIVADGYAPETRTAVVAQNGVTIVVVDLRRTQGVQ